MSDLSRVAVLQHPTLANYRAVLDSEFPRWFLNSVIVAAATMTVGVFLAATSGYAVSRFRFPGHRPLMWRNQGLTDPASRPVSR